MLPHVIIELEIEVDTLFNRKENLKQYIKLYPVISILLFVNITVHVLTYVPTIGDDIFNFGAGANFLIADGEYWRLITSMFLHAGFLHLLFNCFSLYVFAPEMERLLGKARFITLYAIAGLFGNVATYVFLDMRTVSVGASGAIFGVFGAYVALVYYTRKTMPALRQIILPIIIISVVMTFLQPGVNIAAHLGGMTVGFIIGLTYLHPKRILAWRQKKQ